MIINAPSETGEMNSETWGGRRVKKTLVSCIYLLCPGTRTKGSFIILLLLLLLPPPPSSSSFLLLLFQRVSRSRDVTFANIFLRSMSFIEPGPGPRTGTRFGLGPGRGPEPEPGPGPPPGFVIRIKTH